MGIISNNIGWLLIMSKYISESLINENKLTKMIAAGLVSKDGVIRAGRAGMIPSKRRTTTGVLKGLENKMRDNPRNKSFRVFNIDYMDGGYSRNNNYIVLPRNKERRVIVGNHEGNEMSLSNNSNKSGRKGLLSKDNNDNGIVKNLGHFSSGVLAREKELADRINNMYPGTKLSRTSKRLQRVRQDRTIRINNEKYKGVESKIQSYATNASRVRKVDAIHVKLNNATRQLKDANNKLNEFRSRSRLKRGFYRIFRGKNELERLEQNVKNAEDRLEALTTRYKTMLKMD